jgi:23S rRNA (pseudouridine1915-N3)-methyltransferase
VKVSLFFIGRPRDRAANLLAEEYAKRIGRYCQFRMQQVRGEEALEKQDGAYRIVLDPAGREMSSAEIAAVIRKAENGGTRAIAFLVGGADGLSPATRQKAQLALSLSRLTLPHELARVVLLEQIYRAFTMLRGHPYAR